MSKMPSWMDSQTQCAPVTTLGGLGATLSSGFASAASLGCLLAAFSQSAAGVIIVGPAPGVSLAAQTAHYNRQWAVVERARNGGASFRHSPNIILVSGFRTWDGVNDGWAGSGSAAAYGAAYNRQRAIENQVLLGNHWSSSNHNARGSAHRSHGY